MADMPHFDRKMSDAEGLMWRLEKDPHLSSTFANVTILDQRPDFDALLRRMDRAVHVVRRLRQRVQPAPVNLTAPMWVEDPNFDLHYHVRHLALPKPGTLRQLLDLTSLIACDPFDRTRPLWQFVVVDGLRGGRSALIQKLHHTITDGEGGVQLSLQFLDFERDAPEPPPLDVGPHDDVPDNPEPSGQDVLRDLLAGSLRMPLGVLRQIKDLLADPTGIPEAGSAAADTVRGVMSQLSDVEQARSPLWTARSLGRRIETMRAPFGDTRAAAKRMGGTLNTAFLTAAAEAAGRYHERMGTPVDQLRASMAISTRTEASGANAFSLARMMVPTGPMAIDERFAAIQAATGAAREASSTASLETLAAVASTLPTSLITRLARQQAHTVDFATSNVRGAPMAMYVAGAQLMENYPVGPLGGVAFNVTLLSYNHSLDMGVNIDTAAVSDAPLLQRCLQQAFDDLLRA
jgi:WS/DGAT/MGAT family acyltransferase